LYILTDDMRLDDLQFMPQTRALLADQGVTFDNYFDNVTLCCPARAAILRGQYSHNTGVLTNAAPNGGFSAMHSLGLESSTIATAMHDAGYTTGLFGKYLNEYGQNPDDRKYVPPGWDRWSAAVDGDMYGEYRYTVNENGRLVNYGETANDYGTKVYVRQTEDFIRQAADASKPFFAMLAVFAPHEPATPAPADYGAFNGLKAPRDAAFNEADVADKPAYIREREPLTDAQQLRLDTLYRKRAQSLQSVDRGVASLIAGLQAINQLDNTYIVFSSDNGFHLGQHRLPAGKETPYETDIHLPLLIRGPGVPAGTHSTSFSGNVDLAPTFADLGRAKMTDNPDGRSLVPLMTAPDHPPDGWRQLYLLEHWQSTSVVPTGEPSDLDQLDSESGGPTTTIPGQVPRGSRIPEFQGMRLSSLTYVEYINGEKELYDLAKDPDQLDNIAASANPELLSKLHERLDAMRTCAGDACRQIESKPLDLPR
jgi:arylsulfatase A-like enzyme